MGHPSFRLHQRDFSASQSAVRAFGPLGCWKMLVWTFAPQSDRAQTLSKELDVSLQALPYLSGELVGSVRNEGGQEQIPKA